MKLIKSALGAMAVVMTTFVLVLFFTSNALAAGPFERYIGSYKLKTPPSITKYNILYCNWLNIKLMTGLNIDTLNGNQTAEVISITNGGASTQHSYITFFEYNFPNEQYPRSGVLTEEGDTAIYTVNRTVDGYQWKMSKAGSDYLMDIQYFTTSKGNTGVCHYQVQLVKTK